MQIKSSADNFELNYCYRADGRKFSALDADKTGLIYIGSLVYQALDSDTFKFESEASARVVSAARRALISGISMFRSIISRIIWAAPVR